MKLKVKKIPWYASWKGLLWSKPSPIFFQTRWGIHTFGMSYPIDVVVLDRNTVVKKIKTNLQPNRLFFWNPLWNIVIELPQGTITKLHIRQEEKIFLEIF